MAHVDVTQDATAHELGPLREDVVREVVAGLLERAVPVGIPVAQSRRRIGEGMGRRGVAPSVHADALGRDRHDDEAVAHDRHDLVVREEQVVSRGHVVPEHDRGAVARVRTRGAFDEQTGPERRL